MHVVHVLAYDSVGLHRAVRVHFRHVHVVYEVDESPAARGAVVAAGFLLQRFFQDSCTGDETMKWAALAMKMEQF